MAGEINYKQKYLELKQKYMNSVDTAFRLGYEQGSNDAQMQAAQQQQEQQAADQAAMQGQQPGQEQGGAPGEEQQEQEAAPDSAHPAGSELDQHIAKLESMLGKSELTGEDLESLKKSVDSLKQTIELKKSSVAIKSIAKSLNKSAPKPKFAIGEQANHNMNSNAKAALTMQEKIVTDIMKTWEQQESNVTKSVKDILAGEGLAKKE